MDRPTKQARYEVGEGMERLRAYLQTASIAKRCLCFCLLVIATYYLETLLPSTALFDDGWPVWWPPNGCALALLLIVPRGLWFWVVAAFTIATTLGPVGANPPWDRAVIALANALEILLPALMLPPFRTLSEWLQAPRLLWKFCLFALVLGPVLTGVMTGLLLHGPHKAPFATMLLRWSVADALGIIMTTPLYLALVSPEAYRLFHWRELPGTLGTMVSLVGVSYLVFYKSPFPIAYVICPLVLFVAMRTGFSGAVIAINLIAPIVTEATLHGHGPFSVIVQGHGPYRLLAVQGFLLLMMLIAFPISILTVQQKSTATQLKEAFLQMERLASADGLTGVANRRRFDEAFDIEWRRAVRDRQPLALVMLDVDNFKAYNDCYGHPAGDACLRSIAGAISDIPRRGADMVARYGGEEFVMLLPSTDEDGARALAELVCANVRRMALPHAGNVVDIVTISIGCSAIIPAEGIDPCALIEASDRALYRAKQAGRNRVEISNSHIHATGRRRANGMQLLG